MNLVQSDYWLQYVLNTLMQPNITGLYVRLFTNNITPAHGTTIGTFTEATFSGYTPQVLGTFGSAVWNGSMWVVTAPLVTFTDSGAGPDNVYGYYVTNNTNSEWYWAQVAPSAPIVMGPAQPLLGVLPQFAYTDI